MVLHHAGKTPKTVVLYYSALAKTKRGKFISNESKVKTERTSVLDSPPGTSVSFGLNSVLKVFSIYDMATTFRHL
jgi:hypothetical protein